MLYLIKLTGFWLLLLHLIQGSLLYKLLITQLKQFYRLG